MRYSGRITRLQSNHNNIRTDHMDGSFDELPEVGKSFQIFGRSLTPGLDCRAITTTFVREIMDMAKYQGVVSKNRFLQFKTANSTYQLEVKSEER